MLTWAVDRDIEQRLETLGAVTEDNKTALLRKVVVEVLEEMEDVQMAEEVLANPGGLDDRATVFPMARRRS